MNTKSLLKIAQWSGLGIGLLVLLGITISWKEPSKPQQDSKAITTKAEQPSALRKNNTPRVSKEQVKKEVSGLESLHSHKVVMGVLIGVAAIVAIVFVVSHFSGKKINEEKTEKNSTSLANKIFKKEAQKKDIQPSKSPSTEDKDNTNSNNKTHANTIQDNKTNNELNGDTENEINNKRKTGSNSFNSADSTKNVIVNGSPSSKPNTFPSVEIPRISPDNHKQSNSAPICTVNNAHEAIDYDKLNSKGLNKACEKQLKWIKNNVHKTQKNVSQNDNKINTHTTNTFNGNTHNKNGTTILHGTPTETPNSPSNTGHNLNKLLTEDLSDDSPPNFEKRSTMDILNDLKDQTNNKVSRIANELRSDWENYKSKQGSLPSSPEDLEVSTSDVVNKAFYGLKMATQGNNSTNKEELMNNNPLPKISEKPTKYNKDNNLPTTHHHSNTSFTKKNNNSNKKYSDEEKFKKRREKRMRLRENSKNNIPPKDNHPTTNPVYDSNSIINISIETYTNLEKDEKKKNKNSQKKDKKKKQDTNNNNSSNNAKNNNDSPTTNSTKKKNKNRRDRGSRSRSNNKKTLNNELNKENKNNNRNKRRNNNKDNDNQRSKSVTPLKKIKNKKDAHYTNKTKKKHKKRKSSSNNGSPTTNSIKKNNKKILNNKKRQDKKNNSGQKKDKKKKKNKSKNPNRNSKKKTKDSSKKQNNNNSPKNNKKDNNNGSRTANSTEKEKNKAGLTSNEPITIKPNNKNKKKQ